MGNLIKVESQKIRQITSAEDMAQLEINITAYTNAHEHICLTQQDK